MAGRGMGNEVLHHQAAEISGRFRQGDSEHVSQKLTPVSGSRFLYRRSMFTTRKGPPDGCCRIRSVGPLVSFSNDLYARHFAGLQCAGADINAFRLSVHQDANFLHVDAPGAAIVVVGVRNMIAGTRFFLPVM